MLQSRFYNHFKFVSIFVTLSKQIKITDSYNNYMHIKLIHIANSCSLLPVWLVMQKDERLRYVCISSQHCVG